MARRSSSRRKKFFVKEEEGVYCVYDDFFNDIETRDEALVIAMRVIGEIHDTLKDEAINDGPLFIGNMKVTTGLKRSLAELDRRWPFLLTEIYSTPRRINGHVLNIC